MYYNKVFTNNLNYYETILFSIDYFLFITVSVLAVSCRKNQDKNDSAEIAKQSSTAQTSMNHIGIMTAEAIHGSYTSFAAT